VKRADRDRDQKGKGVPARRRPAHRAADQSDSDREKVLATPHGRTGELGELMRAMDWDATPLGPIGSWPNALRSAVNILLNSRHPMFLFWGPELIKIYNDAYRPILAAKHPWALGKSGPEVWPEIWDKIGPMVEGVVQRGEATWNDDLQLIMHRNGFPEESYFTFSYSPIHDDAGEVAGMFCACTETSAKVVGERRLRVLRNLAAAPADARNVTDACRLSAAVLEENREEIPFSLLYLVDDNDQGRGEKMTLVASSGTRAIAESIPPVITSDHARMLPLLRVAKSGDKTEVDDLGKLLVRVPAGPLGEPPKTAVVLPLVDRAQDRPVGALVLGASAHRTFDAESRAFFDLVSSQISASIANARAIANEHRRAEALAQIDRAKTAFFSNVSHEFRTPLTLMLGPTKDLLARLSTRVNGTLDDATLAQLKLIHRNGLRLQKLVNSLLDFSRLEAGHVQASYERIDLPSLTRELVSVFESAFERAGVHLAAELAPIDAAVFVDRDMWEKIVLNLLSNALKFTFTGRVHVDLRTAGDDVVLSVKDTGVGIPEEELPHLFERFHRVEGTRARTHEGSGIGLALVQELAKIHGGTVRVESTVGSGSTFIVTIPTGSAHLPHDRIDPRRSQASTGSAASFVEEALRWLPDANDSDPPPRADLPRPEAKERVLVVDDNADMRDYMRRHLGRFWIVETAEDGTKALASALADPPDLILTDVMMPGLDGFELLRHIRADARTARIPVVILSARAGEEARASGLQAGAVDYLTKPFASSELIARVETQLKMARLRATAEKDRERFYALFEQAPMAVTVFEGADLRLIFQNNAARTLFVSVKQRDGRWHPELVDADLRHAFESAEPSVALQSPVEFEKLDGSTETRWFNTFLQPLRDDDGRVFGVMRASFEITEQVLTQRTLKESEDARVAQAERAVRFSELLVGVIGHDLRNPLSAIMTATGLLEARASSEKISKPLGRIALSADRMERMIAQLLDFGRIRLGRGIALERTQVDLGELVQTIRDELEPVHKRTMNVTSEGNVVGTWDGDRLWQLLSSLAANACQHGMPDAPVNVRIDGAARDKVRVEVDNLGEIPADILPILFEPLWQAEAAREKRHGASGLGLGLYITRQIALAHGGTIHVTSDPKEGTRFVVELPREPGGTADSVFETKGDGVDPVLGWSRPPAAPPPPGPTEGPNA
jgi:signal transduction histidine kinase/CheY-like chemotaxis protein